MEKQPNALRLALAMALLIGAAALRLFGWGSVSTAGAFATHQFLNRLAYERLAQHPAFPYKQFPSLEEIQKYSGVHIASVRPFKIGGLGPDNSDICNYSDHWYNPSTGEGNAPKKANDFFILLKQKLANRGHSFDLEGIIVKENWSIAKDAAWTAHFIQDMTCPLHVVGMPRAEAEEDYPRGLKITGPFRTFDRDLWQSAVQANRADPHGDNADWFDPNYYDGNWPGVTYRSTHFVYEATVEYKYAANWAAFMPDITQHINPDFISLEWKPKIGVEEFAQKVALKTRRKVDNKDEQLMFDGDDLQYSVLRFVTTTLNLTDQFPDLSKRVKVPSREWARAIEATYTLWRASFSALVVRDVKLIKVPKQEGTFRLRVRISNCEPEEIVQGLRAGYKVQGGDIPSTGSLTFERGRSTISSFNQSDPDKSTAFAFSQEFRVDESFIQNPGCRDGKLQVWVEGRYSSIPDSGRTVREIPLRNITHNLKPMPDLVTDEQGTARNTLIGLFGKDEWPLELEIRPVNDPEDDNQAGRVYLQYPEPGKLIGPGDAVTLTVYGEFKGTVRVPPVVGETVDNARRLIERRLFPPDNRLLLKAYVPPHARADDIVSGQEPEGGESVFLGSTVRLFVIRSKPKDPTNGFKPVEGWKPGEKTTGGGETTGGEGGVDKPGLKIGLITIKPPSALLDVDQNPEVTLTATFYDPAGKDITGTVLQEYAVDWWTTDPSIANVAGGGRSAVVSSMGDRTGTVQVVCSLPVKMATVLITFQKGPGTGQSGENPSGFKKVLGWKTKGQESSGGGGTEKDKTERQEACQRSERQFNAALEIDDFEWAQSILDKVWAQSISDKNRACTFYSRGVQDLQLARDRKANQPKNVGGVDNPCFPMSRSFREAIRRGKYAFARKILAAGKDCFFVAAGTAWINKLEKMQEQLDYSERILGALRSNNPHLAQTLLHEGQARGHQFPSSAPKLIRQAIEAQTQPRRNEILRTLMQSLVSAVTGIQQQQRVIPPSFKSSSKYNPNPPPVSAGQSIPFFGYVQEDIKAYLRQMGMEFSRTYGHVFDTDITNEDLNMNLFPASGGGSLTGGGLVDFAAPVRFFFTIWVRVEGRQVPCRGTWYFHFRRGRLEPNGSGSGKMSSVIEIYIPEVKQHWREDMSWRMDPAGSDSFLLIPITPGGRELPPAFLLRRMY